MSRFRPCIDLHEGRVKQIVGGTLVDGASPRTNHVSSRPASWFAELYRRDALTGGHVILLGPGNEAAARSALAAFPGGLQLGGGVRPDNAAAWLDAGASHVIVTSWLFDGGRFDIGRVAALAQLIGRERLVVDLSCRKRGDAYFVATDRWQTVTTLEVTEGLIGRVAEHASELLVHAADVEGRCEGIDEALVGLLARAAACPCTYAGGVRDLSDLELVRRASAGVVDVTVGSALDIFGGAGVRYEDCVAWSRAEPAGALGQSRP